MLGTYMSWHACGCQRALGVSSLLPLRIHRIQFVCEHSREVFSPICPSYPSCFQILNQLILESRVVCHQCHLDVVNKEGIKIPIMTVFFLTSSNSNYQSEYQVSFPIQR